MTLDEVKALNQDAHYINFSSSQLEIAAERLTGSSYRLYCIIKSLCAGRDSADFLISRLCKKIKRSRSTVHRLLYELDHKFYIERRKAGIKGVNISPRFPADTLDFIIKKRRVKSLINERFENPIHYYDYNIIHNNTSAVGIVKRVNQSAPPAAVIFNFKKTGEEKARRESDQKSKENCEKNIQDIQKEIEKENETLKSLKISDVDKKPGALFREMIRINATLLQNSKEAIDRLKSLEIKRDHLMYEIQRIDNRNKPNKPPKDFIHNDGDRTFTHADFSRISRYTDDKKLQKEIFYSVTKGALRDKTIPHAISIALKLINSGVWQTPRGYPANLWR